MSDITDITQPRRRTPGLGRGLSALLGDAAPAEMMRSDGVRAIPVADIVPRADQPRRHFDDVALDELAASIGVRGVLQPIVVRPLGDRFEIVVGERRWRATQRARLSTIPAIVRTFDDGDMFELALIENIQREQLNAVEEGQAYRRLVDDLGHSVQGLSGVLHKSRSHIANLMRLTELPEAVQAMVADGRLQMGHARALIGYADAELLANRAIAEGLSVRTIEALVKKSKKPKSVEPRSMPDRGSDADIALLERQLGDLLGLRVAIAHKGDCGAITVSYATLDQLDLVCQRLSGGAV